MAKGMGATFYLKDGFSQVASKAKGAIEQLREKSQGATEQFKKQSKYTKEAGNSLSSIIKGAAGAAAAYMSFDAAKDFLTDCTMGVMELERANQRLGTLMLNTKGSTQAMVDEIIAYGDELERVTTIEGDATVAGASQLATFQLQGDNIKALLPALQNLAVGQYGVNVSQDQMIQSANLLGKVMQGQTGALSKAGVSFSATQAEILKTGTESQKTATLIEVLNQNFGGLAESMAQTDEGKIVSLKNAWGSVKDEVGYALMPTVSGFVGYIHENIPQIRDTVSGACEKISGTLETVGNAISWVTQNWGWLGPIVYGVVGAIGAYNLIMGICGAFTKKSSAELMAMSAAELIHATSAGVAAGATTALGAAVTFLTSPILGVTLLIAGVIALGVLLYKNWDKLKEGAVSLWGKVKVVFGKFGDFVGGVWQGVCNGVKGGINWIIGGINSMISGAVDKINVLIKGINKVTGVVGIPEIPLLTAPQIPMLAKGGTILRGGSVIVGERGPELLHLNRGATVQPLNSGYGKKEYNNVFHINFYTNELDDAAINRFIARVKFAMANM